MLCSKVVSSGSITTGARIARRCSAFTENALGRASVQNRLYCARTCCASAGDGLGTATVGLDPIALGRSVGGTPYRDSSSFWHPAAVNPIKSATTGAFRSHVVTPGAAPPTVERLGGLPDMASAPLGETPAWPLGVPDWSTGDQLPGLRGGKQCPRVKLRNSRLPHGAAPTTRPACFVSSVTCRPLPVSTSSLLTTPQA